MADIVFESVGKTYHGGTNAVTDLNLEIEDGEFMVLVGPSGCGKTTALRMVAGLEEISSGEIRIGGHRINETEPRKRDVAMVFQNYALYPHMTVFDNIAFPLRSRRISRAEIARRVERAAGMLGLEEMLKRKPRTLSGGQRQRVAMGRAVVREPRAFLMDEPLSNLDAKLRVQMRAEISQLQRRLETTTLYVTHDQVEAQTMGSRIAVMRKGVLQQQGPPQELYDRPANLFVATFIGSPAMNLFRAVVGPDQNGDGIVLVTSGQELRIPPRAASTPDAIASYAGREVALGIRPEHLTDAKVAPDAGAPTLSASVVLVEALGSERLVHVEFEGLPVVTDAVLEVAQDTDAAVRQSLEQEVAEHKVPAVAKLDSRSLYAAGETAEVILDVERLHYFDLQTGDAIR